MNCPYCNKEMISGYLYGDRYRAKWLAETDNLTFGIFAIGGEPVGKVRYLSRQRIKADKCVSCRKMIIDLNEQ